MRAGTTPINRHRSAGLPQTCPYQRQELVARGTCFSQVFWNLPQIREDDHRLRQNNPTTQGEGPSEAFSCPFCQAAGGKGPSEQRAGCQQLLFPEALVQGKPREMRLGRGRGRGEAPSAPQKANGWKTGGGGGLESWKRAPLVAESMAYADPRRGGPAPGGPRRTGGQCRFCWPIFFFCWAAFFLRSRHRLKADKHWQNFKNCCPSPADVHYVSGALRFTA